MPSFLTCSAYLRHPAPPKSVSKGMSSLVHRHCYQLHRLPSKLSRKLPLSQLFLGNTNFQFFQLSSNCYHLHLVRMLIEMLQSRADKQVQNRKFLNMFEWWFNSKNHNDHTDNSNSHSSVFHMRLLLQWNSQIENSELFMWESDKKERKEAVKGR